MKQEDLEKLYQSWDNEKLVNAFKKRNEYTTVALAAMEAVMKKKNIWQEAEKEIEQTKIKTEEHKAIIEASIKSEQSKYEAKMLKDNSNAFDFAKRSLVNGQYIGGKVANQRFKWLRYVLFSLSILTLHTAIFTFFDGSLFKYSFEVFTTLSIILITALILIFKNSKGYYRLWREGSKNVFELKQGNYYFKATIPFNYSASWKMEEYRRGLVKISLPMLFIYITNKEGESIALMSPLTALQSPPPAWPEINNMKIAGNVSFFNGIIGHKLDIIRLKKIIDGLHT